MKPPEILVLVVLVVAAKLVEVVRELLAGSSTVVGFPAEASVLDEIRLEEESDATVENPLDIVELPRAVLAVLDELDEYKDDDVVAGDASGDAIVAADEVLGESVPRVVDRATLEIAAEVGV